METIIPFGMRYTTCNAIERHTQVRAYLGRYSEKLFRTRSTCVYQPRRIFTISMSSFETLLENIISVAFQNFYTELIIVSQGKFSKA